MKKTILILTIITLLLGGTIFVIYKNNQNSNEEVIDIFKEDKKEEKEESKDNIPTTKVTVDIKGMINNPGVYEVDSNSRVNDVITLAGGLKEGADTSNINLAKIVTDEMTIIIYSNEESILLDQNKNKIDIQTELFSAKYLSDISFSSNDYTLNSLLTLLPKEIYIHLTDNYIDEFINTLQLIFEKRVHICMN